VTAGDPEELALAFIATIQGLVITQFTQGLFTLGPGREFKLPAGATLLRMLKA
jgi:hypothetical protein